MLCKASHVSITESGVCVVYYSIQYSRTMVWRGHYDPDVLKLKDLEIVELLIRGKENLHDKKLENSVLLAPVGFSWAGLTYL